MKNMKPLEIAVSQCGKSDRVYSFVFTASGISVTVRDTNGGLIAECWGDDTTAHYKPAYAGGTIKTF